MTRILYFIKRRWLISLLVFLALYLQLYNAVNKKEVFYKANAKVAFIGTDTSFSPEAEAERIREGDFLKRVTESIPGLDAATLKDNLKLKVENENLLNVSFISPNPALASDIVNMACSIFIKERSGAVEAENIQWQARLKAVTGELGSVRYKLDLLQKRLSDLKEKNSDVDKRRAELQARFNELKLKEEELLKLFTQKHPEVISIDDRIAVAREQLDSLPDNSEKYKELADAIEKASEAVSLKRKEYDDVYNSFKNKKEPWSVKLAEKAPLPSEPIDNKKDLFFTTGLLGIFAISLLVGIILEIADTRIYTRQEAEARLKLPVIAEMKRVVIIKKPKGRRSKTKRSLLFNNRKALRLLRKYEHLYTFLKLDVFKGNIDKKIIVVSSAESRAGKTFIASNLALAAAKNGERVLLIDGNFRYPCVGALFGFEDGTKGLSDIIKGSCNHKDAVINLTDLLLTGGLNLDEEELKGFDNLKILLSGTKVDNPVELLGAREFSDLLKELSQSYGLLVIDSCAIRGYADTPHIIPFADTLLMAVRKGSTTYPSLRDAVRQTNNIKGPLAGLVFSNV